MRFIDLYEEYDKKLISLEDMEDIEECEEVVRIEDNGVSSEHYPACWYTAYNIFEDEINFYSQKDMVRHENKYKTDIIYVEQKRLQ